MLLPRLFEALIDDAAVFPPGSAPLPQAVVAHRRHRTAWYADLIGPLLLPASALAEIPGLLEPEEQIDIGVIGDVPVDRLANLIPRSDPRLRIRQVEAAVAQRGEDPLPGVAELGALASQLGLTCYAEIPLTWGLFPALDAVVEQRSAGVTVAAKFRTGGLAAELFPAPGELAAVIRGCRERDLPFKLTAGLHHAIRHVDPASGFTHHGFANVLAATLAVSDGAGTAEATELLTAHDPVPLVERIRPLRDRPRPLWIGFGSCSVTEPLIDLIHLGLLDGDPEDQDENREETR